jgi:hypothetical protein
MAKVQNPSFIESKQQYYGPGFGEKNAPPKKAAPKGLAVARAAGGKALAKGLQNPAGVPAAKGVTGQGGRGLQPTGSVRQNSSDIVNDNINQGFGKGQKGLKVRRTSDGYMKKS